VVVEGVKCHFYAVNSCINKWKLNIHTRIGIISDKFHECKWIFECRCFSSLNERKHTLWIQATQHQSMRGCHIVFTWIHGPTKQKNTTPANQERAHRSKGPPEEANRLSFARTPRKGPRAHQGAAQKKLGPFGVTGGPPTWACHRSGPASTCRLLVIS
jgi:hypothetical protein